jgi:hypothetical protein
MAFLLLDGPLERQPPAATHLLDLRTEPYPDGKRLRVELGLTPFQQKPFLVLTLTDSTGEIVAATSIIEPAAWWLELPLHILKPRTTPGEVNNHTNYLSFPDQGEIDRRDLTVEIPFPKV